MFQNDHTWVVRIEIKVGFYSAESVLHKVFFKEISYGLVAI